MKHIVLSEGSKRVALKVDICLFHIYMYIYIYIYIYNYI